MAELATLARPYANAAFGLAQERGQLERWARLLRLLADALELPALQALVETPSKADAAKAREFAALLGDELDAAGRGFLDVLAANKRLALLPEIQRQFGALKAAAEKTLDVEITAAARLSEAELQQFAAALERRFEQQVDVTARVDAALLGGAVIRAGDTVFDGSVRGKLDKLAESLARA